MSTMESKLEAWLRYVAKQEEAMKQDEPSDAAEEPQTPLEPAAPASTPTLAPRPTVTATIERQISRSAPDLGAVDVSEPQIPEIDDFLPITRRPRAEPPAQAPEVSRARTSDVGEPKFVAPRMAAPPPSPPAPPPAAPPAPARAPEADLFAPSAPTPPQPTIPPRPAQSLVTPAEAPAPAPPRPAPVRPQAKPVESPIATEGVREMWDRLPKHIQLLVGLHPNEVAQKSYKRFKESREDLIERLLDPTLSLEETARILNVCPTTVRRYTNKESLRHFRTAGNQRRFRLSDVLAFMEAQAKKAE